MNVLIACEFSGVVRDAFLKRGHNAISCDLLPTESPGPHIEGNVLPLLKAKWDLLIAHPPCTYLCNSGVRWLYTDQDRWLLMRNGAGFFNALLNADIPKIAIENPVMHKYAREIVGRGPDFTVQPWQFGHGETKRTCFWTKNLPPLQPTNVVAGRENRIHSMPPSADRGKLRSITYQGIADAMAEQWG